MAVTSRPFRRAVIPRSASPRPEQRSQGRRPIARDSLLSRRRVRARLGQGRRGAGRGSRPSRWYPRDLRRLPAGPREPVPSRHRGRSGRLPRTPGPGPQLAHRDRGRVGGGGLAAATLVALKEAGQGRGLPGRHRSGDAPGQPCLADLTGLPPLLIQGGAYEILLDDAVRLAARAAACDMEVTPQITPGVPHVVQAFSAVLDEAGAALHLPESSGRSPGVVLCGY